MTFDSTNRRAMRSTSGIGVRTLWVAALVTALGCGTAWPALAVEPADPWPELARDIFNGRTLADGAGVIAIDMPYRAEDAAIVPVTLRATQWYVLHVQTDVEVTVPYALTLAIHP